MVAAYIHTARKWVCWWKWGRAGKAPWSTTNSNKLVRDITLQIAAAHPLAVSREQVDPL